MTHHAEQAKVVPGAARRDIATRARTAADRAGPKAGRSGQTALEAAATAEVVVAASTPFIPLPGRVDLRLVGVNGLPSPGPSNSPADHDQRDNDEKDPPNHEGSYAVVGVVS